MSNKIIVLYNFYNYVDFLIKKNEKIIARISCF